MKNQIIELGKKYRLELRVGLNKSAFDIWEYEVYHGQLFIGVYTHYTGKTNTGVKYPTESILPQLEKDLKIYTEIRR